MSSEIVLHDPDRSSMSRTGETAATSVAAQAEALVKARYAIAVARPRDWDVAREKLLKTCKRPRFAESAIYHKPVGKGVSGPSIRFAEECARAMGNLDTGCMIVFDDDHKRIVRVSVTDVESNKTYSKDMSIEKTVERSMPRKGQEPISVRVNSRGDKVYVVEATEDELLAKQWSAESKALRGSLLRLMPADIIEEALDVCRKVRSSSTTEDPDAERKRLFDAFSDIGISADQIKKYLGSSSAVLQPSQLDELRSIYVAIRDGEHKWSDYAVNDGDDTASTGSASAGVDAIREAGK